MCATGCKQILMWKKYHNELVFNLKLQKVIEFSRVFQFDNFIQIIIDYINLQY